MTTVTGTLTYPIDTVKRRMMVQKVKTNHYLLISDVCIVVGQCERRSQCRVTSSCV